MKRGNRPSLFVPFQDAFVVAFHPAKFAGQTRKLNRWKQKENQRFRVALHGIQQSLCPGVSWVLSRVSLSALSRVFCQDTQSHTHTHTVGTSILWWWWCWWWWLYSNSPPHPAACSATAAHPVSPGVFRHSVASSWHSYRVQFREVGCVPGSRLSLSLYVQLRVAYSGFVFVFLRIVISVRYFSLILRSSLTFLHSLRFFHCSLSFRFFW